MLVLFSRAAMDSEAFWRGLAAWKLRPVVPMVICLVPKAELSRDPPSDARTELWTWLGHNVAVELTAETDRYVVLLGALDSPDPKQWWWQGGDAPTSRRPARITTGRGRPERVSAAGPQRLARTTCASNGNSMGCPTVTPFRAAAISDYSEPVMDARPPVREICITDRREPPPAST